MKASQVVRARMRNSGLVGKPFASVEEVVRWHGAMQAQDYGPAKWAIGQRARGLVDADVDRALADGSIIRTHVLRPTWHFVARDDIRWMLALTGPRIHKGMGPRWRELGLDAKTLRRSESALARALEGGERLARNDVKEVLQRARIDTTGQRLPHMLIHCELEAVICSGGLEGRQQTYALMDERIPRGGAADTEKALGELIRRYLQSHGPATVQDLRWWSSLTVADIKRGLDMLGDEVRSEIVDGADFWWMPADTPPRPVRGAELVHVYDELLVGYSDTRYFGDPRAADARAAWVDRSMPTGVVLANSLVAGHWRRTVEKDRVDIHMLTYGNADRKALTTAANGLGKFLGLPAKLSVKRL